MSLNDVWMMRVDYEDGRPDLMLSRPSLSTLLPSPHSTLSVLYEGHPVFVMRTSGTPQVEITLIDGRHPLELLLEHANKTASSDV